MSEIRFGVVTENHFPHLGGMEYASHCLSAALQRLPATHVSVAFHAMPSLQRAVRYPYRHYRAPSFSFLTPHLRRRNVERMLRRERINVLYGPMLHGGGARALEIGRRRGLPVLASAQGADIQVVPAIRYGARLDPRAARRIGRVVEGADRIVALSELNRRLLVAAGADPRRVAVIPNGVPWAEIGAVPAADLRPRWGLSDEHFVLVTIGRNSPVKRLELLYRALVVARRRVPEIRCLGVGPRASLADAARRAGAEDAVILTGPIVGEQDPPFPELVNLQRAADLYVSVSYVESFGNAALESLACGTPILVTPRHGVRDVAREGETAFVLRDETPEALAALLVALSERRAELRSRRAAVRASVAHLGWEAVAARYRALAEQVLQEAA